MTFARALGAAAVLAACAGEAAAQAGNVFACVVHPSVDDGRLATCMGRAIPGRGEWRFVLRGREPNIVTRIEIYEPGRDAPL